MSRPNLSEDRDSLDLVPGIQVTIVSSRRTDNVDHGRYGIRTGLAAAPAELIHIVCRLLCLCSYCEPEPNPSPFDLTPLNPVRFRDDLDSLSKTCKFVRDVAQPYLFHVFGPNDRNSTPRLAAKLSAVELPHVANQVRRITLNSVCGELFLLNRLTGLQTLRVMTTRAGGIGLESQLSFPCLKELYYGGSDLITPMEDARKDLRAILSAAENLTRLRCQALWHSSETTPFILLRLPACNITTLELYACWLPHEICKRFLANFVRLENFKLDLTMWLCSDTGLRVPYPKDGPERVADATDVVQGLCQTQKTLKRLVLDFGPRHNTEFSIFRPLSPLVHFTALRTLHVTQGELGYDSQLHRESLSDILPKFMEELLIDNFNDSSRQVLCDLAKRVSAGKYPNLKHVRLKGLYRRSEKGSAFLASMKDELENGDGSGGLDSINTDVQTDHLQADGEGEDEEESEGMSEYSDIDSGFEDWIAVDQEWGAVIRRCLNDNVLMSSIAHRIREHSFLSLYTALNTAPRRNKARMLFSKTNVKFECVGVVIERNLEGGIHEVWM